MSKERKRSKHIYVCFLQTNLCYQLPIICHHHKSPIGYLIIGIK